MFFVCFPPISITIPSYDILHDLQKKKIELVKVEVCRLKKELAEKESQLSVRTNDKAAADDELSWLNVLSCETSENVQERINLQKALFELEETNIRNRTELQQLDDAIAKQQVHFSNICCDCNKLVLDHRYVYMSTYILAAIFPLRSTSSDCTWKFFMLSLLSQAIEKDGTVVDALRARRQLILDNIRDNDEAGINYRKVMTCTNILAFCYYACLCAPYHAAVTVESNLRFGLLVIISFSLPRKLRQMRNINVNSNRRSMKQSITMEIKHICASSVSTDSK